MKELPSVTVIIPARNEARVIGGCLKAVLSQEYPAELLEIIVVDGMSDDGTRDIVEELASSEKGVMGGGSHSIVLLDNPRKIVPAALNIGLRHARGEIIARVDGHCVVAPDFVHQCVSLLQTTGASNVGGTLQAIGKSYAAKAIGLATTSFFGIGDSQFRYSTKEQWVDTVFPGAWHKNTLQQLGGFNEEWIVNQDYEANYRLRKAGGRILLSPKIRCQYYVRESLRGLARQYFRYGLWKVKTLVAHPDSLRWRHLAPPLLIFALAISVLLSVGPWQLAVILPGAYLIADISATLLLIRRGGLKYLPLLPAIFLTLHLCWGLGFWAGLPRFGLPRFSPRTLLRAFRSPV